jgi:8-oxo-dGTP diphosphatase
LLTLLSIMPKSDQKIDLSRYCIIPRVLVFIFYKKNVLLMKVNKRESSWSGYYNGLGGHIEKGEDILSAARREVFEESGLDAKNLKIAGIGIVDTEPRIGIGLFIVKGEVRKKNVKPSNEGRPEWVPLQELNGKKILPDTEEFINRLTKEINQTEPFSFLLSYDEHEELVISYYPENLS